MKKVFALLASLALLAGCASPYHSESVVKLEVGLGGGSGFYAEHPNIIITAAHVVGDDKLVKIVADAGEADGVVLYVDKERDIAIIFTELLGPPSKLDCTPSFKLDKITIVGHPLLWDQKLIRKGYTAGADAVVDNMVPIIIEILPGDSGSPVFDKHGRVIGITVAVITIGNGFITHPTGTSLMVPADEVCDALDTLDAQIGVE